MTTIRKSARSDELQRRARRMARLEMRYEPWRDSNMRRIPTGIIGPPMKVDPNKKLIDDWIARGGPVRRL